MNTIDEMVRMRIDALLGLAGRVRQERELHSEPDAIDASALAATSAPLADRARAAADAPTSDPQAADCPECPTSAQAA